MKWALLLWWSAWADDEALLAPRIADLDASMARATLLLDQSRVFQARLAVGQSRFASEGCTTGGCAVDLAVSLIVEAQEAGHASRDLLQSARAEVERVRTLAAAATVMPLLDAGRREAVEVLTARTERAVRSFLVRSSWYRVRMEPWAGRYRAQVAAACAATVRQVQP